MFWRQKCFFEKIAIKIRFGRVSMSAQIPSITVTSIDTTSDQETTRPVCSLETDTFPEETSPLGVSGSEGDQAKRRMSLRWVEREITLYSEGKSNHNKEQYDYGPRQTGNSL